MKGVCGWVDREGARDAFVVGEVRARVSACVSCLDFMLLYHHSCLAQHAPRRRRSVQHLRPRTDQHGARCRMEADVGAGMEL